MTKELIEKMFVYLICLLAGSSAVLAANMTVDKLIDSYDYDFDTGVINVTTFSDYMIDQNSNGLNDTLVINLTTNALNSSTYLFIVSLNEKTGLLKNYTNATVNSTSQSALVLFDTKLLNLNQYNYSVEVRGQDYGLVFTKYKVQTNSYQSYEKGVNITLISDAAVNNNLLRITLSLNVTENKTTSITVYLKYNNQSISSTKEVTLTTPSQMVDVDFDNETIKSIHYVGNYSIGEVKIGEKLLAVSYNTSSYNYADFAKSSYIKSVVSGAFDNNSNNLSDALQVNFTLNVTEAGDFTLEAPLYTAEGEYVTAIAKNVTLSAGLQTVITEVAGKNIYLTYYNGVFELSFAKLSSGNNTRDILYDAHATNSTFYTDFERPSLPDLKVNISINFSSVTNVTNITVNLSNIGNAPAFNIMINVLDNVSYENESSLSYLNLSDSQVFYFTAQNTTNDSLFIAIADFENLVDESNESNNFIDTSPPPPLPVVSLKIVSLSQLYSLATHKVFEFVIENNGSSAVNNVTWKLNLGDGTVINSTRNTSLAINETIRVHFEYNYSSESDYTVTANATAIAEGVTATKTLVISSAGTLSLSNLKVLYSNLSERVFEFTINNSGDNNLSANWTLNLGDGNVVSSTQNANLNSSKSLLVYVQHDYSAQGDYSVTATAQGGGLTASSSIPAEVEYLGVSNFSVINSSGSLRTFEAYVKNYMAVAMSNVSWSLNTGNGIVSSTSPITLQPQETAFVFAKYNYTATGTFAANFTAVNSSWNDLEALNVTIT
ncbi:hypothetical protein HYV83_00505 [Candidatus Woesearchaeota archaeon]|nr:hypothetical protein [Candidatus Woesearchaeota archaeon]